MSFWKTIDWSKSTHQISSETGKNKAAVSDARKRHAPNTLNQTESKEDRQRRSKKISETLKAKHEAGTYIPPKISAEKRSKIGKIGALSLPQKEAHPAAKSWSIKDFSGRIYTFKNLSNFVRQHEELFDPEDVIWRASGKNLRCRAATGLRNLFAAGSRLKSWKGWTPVAADEANTKNGNEKAQMD